MKKIIIKCTIFLAILFFILVILSRIFVPKNNTREAGISKKKELATGILAEPENTIDLLIVGDSESYTSFVPLEAWHKYGFTSYICGTPAQKLPLTASFIYDAVKKQNPKIIMLETNTIYRRASLVEPLTQISKKILPILEYHNRWKSLKPEDFSGKVDYKYIQEHKGYYFSEVVKPTKNKKYMEETEKKAKVPRSNKLYLKIIKKYCDQKGIELILFSCPSPVNWSTKRHNGIENLAKELGVEYIDLNVYQDKIQIDWEKDSRDEGDHLNYSGSLKTTQYLEEFLSTKNLPDHRNDDSYKSWNQYYEKYIKKVKKDN